MIPESSNLVCRDVLQVVFGVKVQGYEVMIRVAKTYFRLSSGRHEFTLLSSGDVRNGFFKFGSVLSSVRF